MAKQTEYSHMFSGKELRLYNWSMDLFDNKENRELTEELNENLSNLIETSDFGMEIKMVLTIIEEMNHDFGSVIEYGNPMVNLNWNEVSKRYPNAVKELDAFLQDFDYYSF